jgi:hypothetical protein
MAQPSDRRELRLRHAVQSLRISVAESERLLELKLIQQLIEVFHDDKEGLLQALRLANIKPVIQPKYPEFALHAPRSRL